MAKILLSIRELPPTGESTEEYKVLYRRDGKLSEDKSYYTDDLTDAILTVKAMGVEALSQGHTVTTKGWNRLGKAVERDYELTKKPRRSK